MNPPICVPTDRVISALSLRRTMLWLCGVTLSVSAIAADVEPVAGEPVAGEPVAGEPVAGEPAVAVAVAGPAGVASAAATGSEPVRPSTWGTIGDPAGDVDVVEEPWDFSPYRVQIWIAGDDSRTASSRIAGPLAEYLDRDFAAIWKLSIEGAPTSVRTAASRGLANITYDSITSTDPVIAVKRNHPDAARIRFAADVGELVKTTLSTPGRIADVVARGTVIGNPDLNGVAKTLTPVEGDALSLVELWKDEATEAIVTDRGMATKLRDPEAKIISLPIDGLVTETIERTDKLFIVRIETSRLPWTVSVIELDCLMRNFSIVHQRPVSGPAQLIGVIGQAVTEIFAPMIRIEEAGQKTADGLVRAHGLITDASSPAIVHPGDLFVPMVRKNDRNGDPIGIGPLDWSFLLVKEVDGAKLKMDYHAGKAGGLQGRKNKRTFKTATRVRPLRDHTVIRLHAQRNPAAPLVGYELYEKAIDSREMTFVGRTDWDGRIVIEKSDSPLRLMYVKNGGAVLARLPIVPGQSDLEVADLFGDDQRLRAEAYIRGTQNAIVDLVAIRQLLAARIRLRLEKGQLQEAKDLLEALRGEPSYEKIADDMGRKLLQLKGRNAAEQMKIDQMFAQTREMLVKNISPAIIRELEDAVLAAERQGASGQSPPPAQVAAPTEQPSGTETSGGEPAGGESNAAE
jgi:hypothetical protein